jgi:hypothetical protein
MTNTLEDITIALLLAHPDDFEAARKYLQWMQVRRKVTDRFYFRAHWISPERKIHWVGR